MTTYPDLGPALERMSELLRPVTRAQLTAVTPCPGYSLGDLIDHVGGLSIAFSAAATKTTDQLPGGGPSGDASRLEDGWQSRIADDLVTLATVWKHPDAWTGMTSAGGVDLPGEVAGIVALNEVVVHGWDIARSTGQPFSVDDASLHACLDFVAQFVPPDTNNDSEAARSADESGQLFGPQVAVAQDAPLLDRLIGLTGRDPSWRPA